MKLSDNIYLLIKDMEMIGEKKKIVKQANKTQNM
jgi:hypothetical protein